MRGITYVRNLDNSRNIGVSAQELQAVMPELVHKDSNGFLSVAYGNITAVLIEAIKELKSEIEKLKR
jgi:hypothetical protein